MSPTEFAFLALGLVLGVALGAAVIEAVRIRPTPRKEVRVTVVPHSLTGRWPATLNSPERIGGQRPIPGSPEASAWVDVGPGPGSGDLESRTIVPSPGPAHAVAPAASPARAEPRGSDHAGPPRLDGPAAGHDGPSAVAVAARPVAAIVVGAALTAEGHPAGHPAEHSASRPAILPARIDIGERGPGPVVRTRPGGRPPPVVLPEDAVAFPILGAGAEVRLAESHLDVPGRDGAAAASRPAVAPGDAAADGPSGGAAADGPSGSAAPSGPDGGAGGSRGGAGGSRGGAGGSRGGAGGPGGGAGGSRGGTGGSGGGAPGGEADATDVCATERRVASERCALAEAAREQGRAAAEALREAQRAYDSLRERVDRAQALADPRQVRAAKDAAHQAFRAARAAASDPGSAEAAARDWLTEVNRINTEARDAAHVVEANGAELRALLPRLDRLAVEADAARIAAESAEAGCREAREALARCEERALAATPPPPTPLGEAPAPLEPDAPAEPVLPLVAADANGDLSGLPVVLRVLRGDRTARERLVATIAAGDPEAGRAWRTQIADLVDAISARAIEDGFLDFPDGHPFWGMFSIAERREIVGALSALGFRHDGLGMFVDERVPSTRDLTLAVGYAGLDPMRIRRWPREDELAGLYREATVAAGEWLASEAGDLTLGRMVDALGGRAGELADVWNAWGRVRPALLATD